MTSVLVFSRDASWYGGVVNFITLLKHCLSDKVEYSQFKIGRRKKKTSKFVRPFLPLVDAVRLLFLLIHHRYDAYHLNPSLNYSSLLRDGMFMLVLRVMGARNVIVSFHGWDSQVEQKLTTNSLLKTLFLATYRRADHTLVLAEDFRHWLVAIGFNDNRVHLFTTMFDSDEFENVRSIVPRDELRILFLSRLVREKGMYELVESFSILAKDYPSVNLVFAGTGPEEEALKRYVVDTGIEHRVTFLGYVRGIDKVKAFAESSIFVFPTYYGEGCPVSLLEAMAAGLPVITTRVGGIPHIVQDGVNGILLDQVSSTSIEEAIRLLIDDTGLRHKMGERNVDEAWLKYSAPVVTLMFEKLYSGQSL